MPNSSLATHVIRERTKAAQFLTSKFEGATKQESLEYLVMAEYEEN